MADVLNDYALLMRAHYVLGIDTMAITPALMLFIGDIAVACDTTITDLAECTCAGYARHTLVPGTWTVDATTPCVVTASYPSVVFTLTNDGGGQTIYGHAVIDTTGDEILWAQTWTTPFAVPAGGGVVEVFPSWADEQCA